MDVDFPAVQLNPAVRLLWKPSLQSVVRAVVFPVGLGRLRKPGFASPGKLIS